MARFRISTEAVYLQRWHKAHYICVVCLIAFPSVLSGVCVCVCVCVTQVHPLTVLLSATLSFLQRQTQDISLLRIFQLSNIVHHPYQSVQCVCVCMCAHVCVHLLHSYA